jgi:hypothetical protein
MRIRRWLGASFIAAASFAYGSSPPPFLFPLSCVGESRFLNHSDGVIHDCPSDALCTCRYLKRKRSRREQESDFDEYFARHCAPGEKPCQRTPHVTPRYASNAFQALIVASVVSSTKKNLQLVHHDHFGSDCAASFLSAMAYIFLSSSHGNIHGT